VDLLDALDLTLRTFNMRLPEVEPTRCVATRYRASTCDRCIAVCPVDAIEPVPRLTVDADRCVGCGACATACPTGALDFAQPRAALHAGLRAAGARPERMMTVACPHGDMSAGRGVGMRVDCLGGIGAADLLAAWACGLRSLDLVSGDCAQCTLGAAISRLSAAGDAAVSLLTAAGAKTPLDVTRVISPEDSQGEAVVGSKHAPARSQGPVLTRRQLFLFFRHRSARLASTALSKDDTSISALHATAAPPPAHRRLLGYLAALPAGQDDVTVPIEPFHLAAVEVSRACDGCGLCARYCPHSALTVVRDRAKIDARLCTACGLCAEVCPPAAIVLRPAILLLGGNR
jgi:ferredoxin